MNDTLLRLSFLLPSCRSFADVSAIRYSHAVPWGVSASEHQLGVVRLCAPPRKAHTGQQLSRERAKKQRIWRLGQEVRRKRCRSYGFPVLGPWLYQCHAWPRQLTCRQTGGLNFPTDRRCRPVVVVEVTLHDRCAVHRASSSPS